MRHKQLAVRVKFMKTNESEMSAMRSALDDFQEEVKKETLLNSIRNAMESWKLSVDDAMNGLKIPLELQAEFRSLI